MYFLLTAGWVVYFVLHSTLASEVVKKIFLVGARTYRLLYSIFSIVSLAGLLVLNGSIPSDYFFLSEGIVRYISLMLTTFGVMLIQLSFRYYDLKSFLGLADEGKELRMDGLLKYLRHPIYAGLIMVTLGFFLFIPNLPTLISCLCIFAYLPVGIYLEEKKLLIAFGDAYRRYKEQVPAILPRIPIGR